VTKPGAHRVNVVEPPAPEQLGDMDDKQQLSTFSKPPSTMTEEEISELAEQIIDQWSKDIAESNRRRG
jgi:hypothetical protein